MLKRPRGESIEVPPLPQISHDLTLDVFTHPSLRRETPRVEDYGDNERLSLLGGAVLRATLAHALFSRRPMLLSSEFSSRCNQLAAVDNLAKWAEIYGMNRKLRRHPSLSSMTNENEDGAQAFQAYVGAIYTEHGEPAVAEWISQLLQLADKPQHSVSPNVDISKNIKELPPQKKAKGDDDFVTIGSPSTSAPLRGMPLPAPATAMRAVMPPAPSLHAYTTSMKQPYLQPSTPTYQAPSSTLMKQYMAHAPPPQQPMGPPVPRTFPNPLAPAQPNLPFLPLFNQTAAQRKVSVEYPAVFSGPAHAGQWNVQCVVNGIVKGFGRGNSKQVAKEQAARQAFYAMGWT